MIRTLLFAHEAVPSLLADGSDSRDKPKLYRLQLSVTEVGTEKFDDNSIQVRTPSCYSSTLPLVVLTLQWVVSSTC